MKRKSPIDAATAYAAEWGLNCRSARLVEKHRAWWFFKVRSYLVEINTSDGIVRAWLLGNLRVCEFIYEPNNKSGCLLPLWAAFPGYSSVTMGWRMGAGEEYKYKWHGWYRSLTDAERAAYKQRFPPPTDKERAWGANWYEEIADTPASHVTKERAIVDLLTGRV